MSKTFTGALFVLFGLSVSGCPRAVVLDPADVAAHNQADWTVKSTPSSPSTASHTPTAAPPRAR